MTPKYTADLGSVFFPTLLAICADLSVQPLHLLSVMHSEAGISAKAHNPHGNASGLIQFMPATLAKLGWPDGHAAFRKLDATQQLPWVKKYFHPYRGKLPSIGAVYTATFLPAQLHGASNPDFTLTAKDGPLGWAYAPNAVLDANKDYRITVGELEQAVRRNCVGVRWAEAVARLEGREITPELHLPLSADLGTTIGAQRALARLGYDPGPLDGIPGPRTTAAVTAFQRAHGLVVDGIYGPRTRAALGAALNVVLAGSA